MFSLLKIKALLIGLLLASPPIAAWIIRQPEPATHQAGHATPHMRIPLEVHAKGEQAKLVFVNVQTSPTVPEPSSLLLVLPAALLTLRRRR